MDNMTNAEKARLVLHFADGFDLHPKNLLSRAAIACSTFYYSFKRLDRPDRNE